MTTLRMLGHFAACPTNTVCIGSLASRFRVITASCSARCLCALCASPFPSIRSALDSHALSLVPDPPVSPSLSLLSSLVTQSPARLPRRADPLSSPLFPPPSLTQEAQHVQSCLHSGVLLLTSILHYKIPLDLALLLRPHSSRIQQSYEIRSTV